MLKICYSKRNGLFAISCCEPRPWNHVRRITFSHSQKQASLNTNYYSRYIIYVNVYEKCCDYQSESWLLKSIKVLAQFMTWQTLKGGTPLVNVSCFYEMYFHERTFSGKSVFQFIFHIRLTMILFPTNYVGKRCRIIYEACFIWNIWLICH